MSKICLLGYVCVNPDDQEDVRVFRSLEEITTQSSKCRDKDETFLSAPIDIQFLPIIKEKLLTKQNVVFPLPLQDTCENDNKIIPKQPWAKYISKGATSLVGQIEWKCHPSLIFKEKVPQYGIQEDFLKKHSIPISTNRKTLKQLLTRLAVSKGMSDAAKRSDTTRYYSDYFLVDDKDPESLVMYYDTDRLHNKFEVLGMYVEDYLTNRKFGRKCYQVFSIHVLFHPETKAHFIYTAQIDGFLYDRAAKVLTPVEIKCVKAHKLNLEIQYLQATLGQVSKMIFARYNNFVDSKGIERWTVCYFEPRDVPKGGIFPEYGNDRILLLSKLVEYNRNIPSLMTIVENTSGDIFKVRFANSNSYEEEVSLNCVLGKCKHKTNPNATARSKKRCRKNLNKWIRSLGENGLNTRTAFT